MDMALSGSLSRAVASARPAGASERSEPRPPPQKSWGVGVGFTCGPLPCSRASASTEPRGPSARRSSVPSETARRQDADRPASSGRGSRSSLSGPGPSVFRYAHGARETGELKRPAASTTKHGEVSQEIFMALWSPKGGPSLRLSAAANFRMSDSADVPNRAGFICRTPPRVDRGRPREW